MKAISDELTSDQSQDAANKVSANFMVHASTEQIHETAQAASTASNKTQR